MSPSPVPLRKAAWSRGLTEAMVLLDRAKSRPPTEADAPPPSSFPMTPGAREALRMAREADGKRGGLGSKGKGRAK